VLGVNALMNDRAQRVGKAIVLEARLAIAVGACTREGRCSFGWELRDADTQKSFPLPLHEGGLHIPFGCRESSAPLEAMGDPCPKGQLDGQRRYGLEGILHDDAGYIYFVPTSIEALP